MRMPKADMHVDTIEYMLDNNMCLLDRKLSFNICDAKSYLPYIQLFACFVHDKYNQKGYDRVNKILDYYFKQQNQNSTNVITIKNKGDIIKTIENNKIGAVLTLENAAALDGKEENIYNLYEKYIKLITITWNYDNELGSGCKSVLDSGITKFGKRCVKIMNDLGIIIDGSHASIKTFNDIMSITNKPIVASHSNAYSICQSERNLTDNQIKDIAGNNGIIGITYCNEFLSNNDCYTTLKDVVKHISYVSNLIGTEHVCLGSDFDGVSKNKLPNNLKGIKDVNKLEECLIYEGFNNKEIENIMGNNLLNFLKNNLN